MSLENIQTNIYISEILYLFEEMTERVLKILRRQTKRICCVFDGELLETLFSKNIKGLIEQIEEIGSIRKNVAVFDHQLKPETYSMFINCGISLTIVPSDKDVYMALECLDIINTQEPDILCLGIVNDALLPVVVTARETMDILLIAQTKKHSENYLPFTDFMIIIEDLVK